MLGSAIPSSRFLTEHLLSQIAWREIATAVEYGPGVGTFTGQILRRMRPGTRLVAIESSADFAAYLRHAFADPRLSVVHGSAAAVEQILYDMGIEGADCIISGIPFTTMPQRTRESILRSSHRVLRPGGNFIGFQFTGAVMPHLREVFGEVRQEFELLNILPARIFCCSR